jgi:lipoate-protein ligase A
MQGQFKTPGGKLVIVDFQVVDGLLRKVTVHGDFFLYPDEAFPALSAALEGAPAGLSEALIADRVRRGLPAGAELVGASPEAIATAITRGLVAPFGDRA